MCVVRPYQLSLKCLSTDDVAYGDRNSAHNVLAQFKRRYGSIISQVDSNHESYGRNVVLRRALLYPVTPLQPNTLSQPWSPPVSLLRS